MSVYADYQQFMEELSLVDPVSDTARKPVFLDVFSGLNAPPAKAFLWCQWEVVTPIDIEIDQDLDDQYARWIHDQEHLVDALPSLHGCMLLCDCPHNQLCHGDIICALIWTTTTSRSTLPRRRRQQGVRKVALLAAGLRPVRAVPIRFSQETVIGALMALCPHTHWAGFQWPMIEDLLIDDSHFGWLATMQTREDWHGQAVGPSLVGPIERAAISLHGFQQAGAAAAAKAMPPLIPFGVGDERHFELALDLKTQPTLFESTGVVDDDLLFAADRYWQLGVSLRIVWQRMTRWIHELARRTWPITEWMRQFQPPGPTSKIPHLVRCCTMGLVGRRAPYSQFEVMSARRSYCSGWVGRRSSRVLWASHVLGATLSSSTPLPPHSTVLHSATQRKAEGH